LADGLLAARLAVRAPCICRDRKIHTPMSARNGSHETSSDTNHGTSFSCGRTEIEIGLL
jgi:hypothetical protein